jgi:hypothetical protein
MLNFYKFITEAANNNEFNINDAKGKAFEILSGSHLRHGTNEKGLPKNFLSHFRDENGKAPGEVLSYIKSEMDKRHPGMFDQINEHARQAALHMKSNLKDAGHHTIHDIAWTSQPSDHKSFTGHEDPNSDADIMLRTNKGPIGISLKYGNQQHPNLRNPGLDSIEKLADLKKGDITSVFNEHQNRLKGFGFTGSQSQNHEEFKKNKNSPASLAAVESSLTARREIARKWQNGYSKMNSDQLREKIVSLVSPETKFEHFRLHTRPTASGVQHHMGPVQEDIRNSLSNYAEFKAVPHSGSGITVQILGRHHGSNDFHPVVIHGVKGTSGPMKGMNGTTKLMLKTPKKAKTISPEERGSGEHGGKNFYGPGE